ncbi:hypothetical protein GW17_00014708, partial [Ensete ventricosum]
LVASGSSLRVPCSRPPCGHYAASDYHTYGLVAAHRARRRRPYLQGAWVAAWPWVAGPTWGLAVAGRPSSSLPLLRKCSKNA